MDQSLRRDLHQRRLERDEVGDVELPIPTDRLVPRVREAPEQMLPDEALGAGDQHTHARERSWEMGLKLAPLAMT